MSIRVHLVSIIVAAALGVAAFAGLLVAGFQATDYALRRADGAGQQLEALYELDGATGRYGRQVANQLLAGYDRSGALQTARNDMERVLANLARATRQELNLFTGTEDLQRELPELEQVRRMTDLYHAIDAAAKRAFSLASSGDGGEAGRVLSREVDFRLANEMQPLIDAGIAEERREVSAQTDNFASARAMLLGAAAVASALLLAAVALLTWLLGRRVSRATAGAAAEAAAQIATLETKLKALESTRSHLLADIGHQLRTPLTVLRGEADVALRGAADDPEALRSAMQRVRAQAAELALLFDDLIDAARQDADAQPLEMQPLRLEDVAAVSVDEGRMLAEAREVTIAARIGDDGAEVEGDFRHLKQAVMIGIDNAVKHSAPGTIVELSTAVEARRAVLRIADTGPGIAEEDQPYLFQRFFRGRADQEMLTPGFGIGLAIAKAIVERQGGTVSLTNRAEGGALFEIALPLRVAR